ncbi:RNA polymerase sigma factor [Psychromicrobium lacuslunae]|uniref:RNA polymerase sigma24 factor n=1 Tax=Psychromicrobium lacuslunae TaxID=1618207 RepID=A0A0D4C278_9MICC|nr:RNA polymerase sigma factor [Psychromicrobium lacuslunae]AJT42639.1 hypothetical protein UM93_16280 [Psychromicrobium lacuslunae]
MPEKLPFEQLVQRHGATVLRVCRAIVGANEAEDAWSETFLSALRAYPGLPAEANIEAWLVTIAHRKAIDLTRRQARQPVASSAIAEHPSALGIPGSGEPELLAAVAQLPAKQRSAVAYHFLAELPYQEVARILGCSTEAARRAASDGVKKLREIINPKATDHD